MSQRRNVNVGALVDDEDSYGIFGRPVPLAETSPLLNLGVGQKIHFTKNFHVMATLRNMTLFMTSQGFENYFSISGSLGLRF